MNAKIKLLESRVGQVVERLRAVSAERERLQNELSVLQGKLESIEARTDDDEPRWDPMLAERLSDLRSALGEAIGELRRD